MNNRDLIVVLTRSILPLGLEVAADVMCSIHKAELLDHVSKLQSLPDDVSMNELIEVVDEVASTTKRIISKMRDNIHQIIHDKGVSSADQVVEDLNVVKTFFEMVNYIIRAAMRLELVSFDGFGVVYEAIKGFVDTAMKLEVIYKIDSIIIKRDA